MRNTVVSVVCLFCAAHFSTICLQNALILQKVLHDVSLFTKRLGITEKIARGGVSIARVMGGCSSRYIYRLRQDSQKLAKARLG